jgi:hypothetical protein
MTKATYEVKWKKLSALSDKEVSESVEKYANTISKMALSGVEVPPSVYEAIFIKIEELILNG